MKFHLSKWKVVLTLLFFLPALAACGGGGSGGNGGGGGGGGVPAAYTGVTTQAAITAGNAQSFASGTWNGGEASSQVGQVLPMAVGDAPSVSSSLPGMVQTAQFLKAPVLQIDPVGTPAARPEATVSNTLQGNCGSGTASYTISGDSSSGAFSGSLTFDKYCQDGTTVSGAMTLSGQGDPNTGNISRLDLKFASLDFSDGTDSATLSGTIGAAVAAGGNGETDTFNLVLRDAATSKTFWLDNLVANITYGTDTEQLTLSGRVYDSDYGFIGISTPTPVTGPTSASLPTGGTLLFSGKNNSSAELTFTSGGAQLQVDADGDGTFEKTFTNAL